MSTIDKIIIQHLKSSDVITDSSSEISQDFDGQKHPKIPEVSELEYGEVALNVAKDYEIIGIKNNNGEFVYLPFNLAKRMIEVEVGLEDLRENDIQPYLIKTLKNEPDSYLKNVQYNIENNNVSYIEDYVSSSIIGSRTDQPLPVSLPDPSNSFRNIFVTPTENKQAEYIYVSDSKGKYYNLIPASRYFYRDDDGEQQSFVLEPGRRFIWASNVLNIRDLGGIPTKSNGYIAYDKIIRGSELDGHYVNADDIGIEAMRSLHFTLELDLRYDSEINNDHSEGQSEFATRYKQISFIRFENIRTLDNDEKAKIKDAFETVANEVISGGKVYIHCAWGYHRAGFLATLIEGILGATQYEIDKDYELSSFSPLGVVKRTDSNYKNGIAAINEQYDGSWVKFAKACGISEELIDSFRKAMIVEVQNCEDSGNQYIEVTYDELKKLRDKKNLIPGAKYRMIDFDTYDGTQSDFASCSGIPDLPEFKSAYHHFDLLLTALSTNELDSNVKALHSARDTEGYFINQDLSKWELKYDLDNDKSKYSWAVNYDNVIGYEEKQEQKSEILKSDLLGDDFRRLHIDIGNESFIIKDVYQDGNNIYGTIVYSTISEYVGCKVLLIFAFLSNMLYSLNVYGNGHIALYYLDENCIKYLTKEVPIYEHIEGKGVIYYMKDEYNNEVPYDFKNIMFKYMDNWYYTFNNQSYNIIIKPWIDNLGQHLNRNIFTNGQIIKDCFFDFNTHDNILKDNIINVKIGMYSNNNTLINLESVKLGYDNINIYLENFVDSNIGNECYNLELYGNDNVIIVEDFVSNKIGAAVGEYTKIYNEIEYSSIKDINTRILYTNGDEKLVKIIGELTKNDLPDFNNIKEVEIGNGVTSIEGFVFYNCTRLASVAIPDSVTSIGIYAFRGCSSLTSVAIPNSVTSIGDSAFRGCSSLTSITIPNSVTSIGDYVFYDCSSLTSVTIPDSVTRIGYSAFYGCSNLTSVTIPDSVTSIGDSAFQGCSSLTSVTIPDSVTSIGIYAFYGCSNLTSITIPDSVTSIEAYAFHECRNLTSVTCMPVTPPSLGISPIPTTTATIEVPAQSVDAYKSASGWSDYASKIVAI